jgi:hypothetical protein
VSVHVHLDTCEQGADYVGTLLLQFTAVQCTGHRPEAEFLDVIGTKLFSSLLFTVTSTMDFTPLPHLSKCFETGLQCKRYILKPQV